MDFNLTEERRMLQESLRRYLADHISTESRNAAITSAHGFSNDIWQGLAGLGMIGALFSEEDGGYGGGGFDIAVVFEEIGRAGAIEPLLENAILGGGLLAALGNGPQKALLAEVMDGKAQLALAYGEAAGRYDLAHVETQATASAQGYLLSGEKVVVLNGGAAAHLIVSARHDDGISLFLVDAGAAGLTRRSYGTLTGGHSADIGFKACPAALLGPLNGGQAALETAIARATLAVCAEALGLMETAKDLTVAYLGTRQQFGRPLGSFQVLQHRMADMLIEIEQARSVVINAASHLEAAPPERDRQISAAKNLIGRVGRMVAEEAIQLHGGIGMTQEYDLAHFAKRLVMIDHLFGDTDTHLERFIALSS